MPNAEPVLLCLILAVLCLIAWQSIRTPGHVTKATGAMADVTDSVKFANAVMQQLRDVIAGLPRDIARQFPEARDVRVIREPAAAKPASTVTVEQLGAGSVPPPTAHAYDPTRMEALERRMEALRSDFGATATEASTAAPGFMLVNGPGGVSVQPTTGAQTMPMADPVPGVVPAAASVAA